MPQSEAVPNADSNDHSHFAVLAEIKDYDRPLYLTQITFARLIDDVVLPYQTGEAFFIDGVPVTRERLVRLKIIKQASDFAGILDHFHDTMRNAAPEIRKIFGEQYETRLSAILRECGEDVTSQVIKAFDSKIKPSAKDYLPKREELISG